MTQAEGTMFFDTNLIEAYKLARRYADQSGRVATMPDIVGAKIGADPHNLIWTRYFSTVSGEFYGKSKAGNPVIIVSHDVSKVLNNNDIMNRSRKWIQLTSEEFHDLEAGKLAPVYDILDLATVVNMRQYPSEILNYTEARAADPLLRVRLGPKVDEFLTKHLDITKKESGNNCVIENDHRYPYIRSEDENTGGLLHITQLINMHHSHDRRGCSSVISQIENGEINSAGRFIAIDGLGKLGKLNGGLEEIFGNFSQNWRRLLIPNLDTNVPDMYTLMSIGKEWFTHYRKTDASMDTGEPQFHVVSMKEVPGPSTFTTWIGGYHGFFKYGLDEVKFIAPAAANAYHMGEPQIVYKNGNPSEHSTPITWYKVEVDTSQRLLRESEIGKKFALVKKLLSK